MFTANPLPNPSTMTDREIAEETLESLRMFRQAIEALSNNPMMRAMVPGGIGF